MTIITNDGKDQALTLLCGGEDPWSWGGSDASCRFTFERDGTGTISCGENQHDWFAIETKWALAEDPAKVDKTTWRFNIELTFTTRIASWYHQENPWLEGAALEDHLKNPPPASEAPFPWAPLHSAAFCSKKYSFTLSRGRFIEPFQYFTKKPYPLFRPNRYAPSRYSSQITFDKSPYPPREQWHETGRNGVLLGLSLDYQRHWEKTKFVRGGIAKKDETWAETLDPSWWLSPTIGEAYERGMAL